MEPREVSNISIRSCKAARWACTFATARSTGDSTPVGTIAFEAALRLDDCAGWFIVEWRGLIYELGGYACAYEDPRALAELAIAEEGPGNADEPSKFGVDWIGGT